MCQTGQLDVPSNVYEDDSSIADSERLFRRIQSGSFRRNDAGSITGIQSDAFQDASVQMTIKRGYPAVGMSVQVESIMQATDLSQDDLLANRPGEGLAALTVGDIRGEGQGIVLMPEPDDPAHALVFEKHRPKKNPRTRKRLSELATITREPNRGS